MAKTWKSYRKAKDQRTRSIDICACTSAVNLELWVVLCEKDDRSALWAYLGLKTRGLQPIELVSSDVLAYSRRWEHRLSGHSASIEITLFDGRKIQSDRIWGVLNRLSEVKSDHLSRSSPADREYAIQELGSFFLSWLNCLPQPILNPATPLGLPGHFRHASEWAILASKAGLPTPPYLKTSNEPDNEFGDHQGRLVPTSEVSTIVIVIGDQVAASNNLIMAPSYLEAACIRLSKLANTPLLGIEFATDANGEWLFAGATPLPDLRLGGEDLLNKLAKIMRGGQR